MHTCGRLITIHQLLADSGEDLICVATLPIILCWLVQRPWFHYTVCNMILEPFQYQYCLGPSVRTSHTDGSKHLISVNSGLMQGV